MFKTDEYTYADDNGNEHSINVHVVDLDKDAPRDPDTDRRLPLKVETTGGVQEVQNGAVLVQQPNPNFWDVTTADALSEAGWSAPSDVSTDVEADAAPVEDTSGDPGDVPPVL